jgi:hypothetical protein
MAVRIFYVDESFDSDKFCLTAIGVRHREWKTTFDEIKAHRVALKKVHGLPIREEIHARDFVAGRGSLGGAKLGKWQRSRVFLGLLQLVARLPVMVINVCLDVKGHRDVHLTAWDRLVNRIERTMNAFDANELRVRGLLSAEAAKHLSANDAAEIKRRLDAFSARAIVISDEGHENDITAALRRMHVYNPVPSKFGQWAPGERTKNITTDRIIEDPVFKKSERSYFLQLADCVAFALLKREVNPTPNIKKYNIHRMFDVTMPAVCWVKASPTNQFGIVRK